MKANNFNFELYKEEGFIFGLCRAADLDKIDIKCKVDKFKAGEKCISVLPEAKTVIIVGNIIKSGDDVCRKGINGILADDFPSYKEARIKAKAIADDLIKLGYKAKTTVSISIKNACVLSGIGVYGKNALIINPTYGTYIRFSCVVTNYVPNSYGEKLKDFNPCNGCDEYIKACPGSCLEEYVVDGLKCMCTYIEKGQKVLQTLPMCCVCQDVCKYNK